MINLINEKKLREKLRWLIRPFKNSFNVPDDLVDQIVKVVSECELETEEPLETAEEEAPAVEE